MGSYQQIRRSSFQPSKVSQVPGLQKKKLNQILPQQQGRGQTLEEMRISRANAERLGDHMVNLFPSASAPAVQAKSTEEDSGGQGVEETNSPVVMRKCEACEGEEKEKSSTLQCKEDIAEGSKKETPERSKSSKRGRGGTPSGEKLDQIENRFRYLIRRARQVGYHVAADNLERFLDGTGGRKQISLEWLMSFGRFRGALNKNHQRLKGDARREAP